MANNNNNNNGMAMMMSSSVEIHSFIDLSMGNWFLMEKLQFQWNSGGKEYKRKRQICHLMDMIECSLQRVSCEKARRKESVVFAISTRGCETISLIDLIDYNINYNLCNREVIVAHCSCLCSLADIISKIFLWTFLDQMIIIERNSSIMFYTADTNAT